jgi:DNA-binding NtrC family response regulator
MEKERILVVDDDSSIRAFLLLALNEAGYTVDLAVSAEEAIFRCNSVDYDLVITDVILPRMSGLDLVQHLKRDGRHTGPEIIVITAFAAIEDVVQAMRVGAHTYIQKPFGVDQIEIEVERALKYSRLLKENESLRQEVEKARHSRTIIGKSPKMQEVFNQIDAVAHTDATVLILGETGTGKDLVARALHQSSPRRAHKFVAVNCGALQESLLENELFGHEKGAFTGAHRREIGRFELADRGAIFLDEIGEISPALQIKLLRVLQYGEFQRVGSPETIKVDVRVIAATNVALEKKVMKGSFRQDLYYRLNVVTIELPPLRERVEDIPLLAHHFLQQYGPDKLIDKETMRYLCDYPWPGNVRELENVIEHACIFARHHKTIKPEHLPAKIRKGYETLVPIGERRSLEAIERLHIQAILDETRWVIKHAAEILEIDRSTLYKKIEKYGLRRTL